MVSIDSQGRMDSMRERVKAMLTSCLKGGYLESLWTSRIAWMAPTGICTPQAQQGMAKDTVSRRKDHVHHFQFNQLVLAIKKMPM